jgi:type II secretory pathway component PulL
VVPSQEWRLSDMPFLLLGRSGQKERAGRASLGALPHATRTVLIVAARDVLMLTAALPPVKGQRLRQALPNVVEDQILQDPHDCHIALDPQSLADGERLLAVIDRGWFRFIVESFTGAGHRNLRAVPVTRCVPDVPPAAHSEAGTVEPNEKGVGTSVGGTLPLETTLARAALSCSLDLCQFEFESRRWRIDRAMAKRLRVPIALGVCSLVVAIIGANVQWMMLARERDALNEQMTELLLNAFPKTTVVLDASAQMKTQLDRLRRAAGQASPDDFLSLAARLTPALGPLPANGIAALDYHDRSLGVTFKAQVTADAGFPARLAQSGLTARVRQFARKNSPI